MFNDLLRSRIMNLGGLCFFGSLSLIAPPAAASQPKPNPPSQQQLDAEENARAARARAEQERRERESLAAADAARRAEEAKARDRFVETYTRINSPRVLVWVSASRIASTDLPAGWENDQSTLLSSIESHLTREQIEVVDAASLREADRRRLALAGVNMYEDIDFIRSLGQQSDIFLHVQLRPTAGSSRYRVTVDTTIIASGRRIASTFYDWNHGVDVQGVDNTGKSVVLDWMSSFASAFDRGGASEVKYTVQLDGLADAAAIRKARDAFERIPGVGKVVDREFLSDGSIGSATLTVHYAGRPLDLVTDLQVVARRDLGLHVRAGSISAGSITLHAEDASKPKAARKRTAATFFAAGEEGDKARADLGTAYAKQGSPRIAVIVNRELTADEAGVTSSGGATSGNPGAGAASGNSAGLVQYVQFFAASSPQTPSGETKSGSIPAATGGSEADESLDARSMEAELYKVVKDQFGFRMVDASVVRAQILKAAKVTSEILKEEEAAAILRLSKEADIIISGSGRFQEATPQVADNRDQGPWVHYSFRAVRVSDGMVLAAENKSRQLISGDKTSTESIRQLIAKDITASLVHQMLTSWSPPSILTVTVSNAKTQQNVFTIMKAFEEDLQLAERATFIEHLAGTEDGIGRFEIRYNGTFEDLIKAIEANKTKLNFDLDARGASRDEGLKIRIKEGL